MMPENAASTRVRKQTGLNGSFALTFSAVDSVLVVGYQPKEDQDFYYSSKAMTGQASSGKNPDPPAPGTGKGRELRVEGAPLTRREIIRYYRRGLGRASHAPIG